jgi:hypothetical protein
VTGLSVILDYVETGNTVGLPEAYGLASGVAFLAIPVSSLPSGLSSPIVQLENVPTQVFSQLAAGGTTGIAEARKLIAPLAAYDTQANSVLGGMANLFDTLGTQYSGATQPFSAMVVQFSQMLQAFEVQPSGGQ